MDENVARIIIIFCGQVVGVGMENNKTTISRDRGPIAIAVALLPPDETDIREVWWVWISWIKCLGIRWHHLLRGWKHPIQIQYSDHQPKRRIETIAIRLGSIRAVEMRLVSPNCRSRINISILPLVSPGANCWPETRRLRNGHRLICWEQDWPDRQCDRFLHPLDTDESIET